MVQLRLNAVSDARLTVDGRFGRLTTQAVLAFQRAHGIQADGRVGPQTWSRLFPAFPDHTLTGGSSGEPVRLLQQQLNAVTGSAVVADGHFSPRTTSAVRAFQRAHGMTPDGTVERSTWIALFSSWQAP
jgi:peptidoglycan hydrolase-like protein with peptidoglycan-binding domain